MYKNVVVALVAIAALLTLHFLIPTKEVVILSISAEKQIQIEEPVIYEFPSVELKYMQLHLNKTIIDEISTNFYTQWSLYFFTANYTLARINNSDYIHLQTDQWNLLLDLDKRNKETIARFYLPPENKTPNFSQYPYGASHFMDTAPENVPQSIKDNVAEVLDNAGLNRRELIQGVLALPEEEQTLGWYFLAHLEGQGFSTSSGSFIADSRIMDAHTVYENVHYTYLAWQLFPWTKELSLEEVVAYVLPHRNGKEPLQRWRKIFFDALGPAVIEMKDPQEVGQFLINISQRLIVYNGDTFWEDQGPLTLLETHQGRSGEMAVLGTALFRAVGIPAGTLVMSWWARADGNHGFNYAILTIEGEPYLIQFDQLWNNTAIGNRTAKTYLSQTFGESVDVTSLIASTGNVTVNIGKPFIDAYLNLFNYGSWVSLMQEESDALGIVTFSDVGNNQDYLFAVSYDPIYFDDDGSLLAIPPFIVEAKTSKIHFFAFEDPFTIEQKGDLKFTLSNLQSYMRHDLYVYSTEGFVRVKSFFPTKSGEITLDIGKEDRLYLLKDADGLMEGNYARPFVLKEGLPEFY